MVEHGIHNPGVEGSSPSWRTILRSPPLEKERPRFPLIVEEKARLESIRSHGKSLWEQLRANTNTYETLITDRPDGLPDDVVEQLNIDAQYESYIKREIAQVSKTKRLENWNIPETFDYESVSGLRNEARLKLIRFRPETLGQASRIDGVTPAEIGLLQVFITRQTAANDS